MAPSLSLLPTEVQCSIIRHLDPISLISMSQTSTYLRHLISPKKRHFTERLLQLELLPQHGGACPSFRARDNHISPGPLDPEWEDIRWACTSCLRLLPHLHFDNHSILRLRYRKPSPLIFSPSQAVTSWEPVGNRVPRRPKKGKDTCALLEDKKQRQRYLICTSGGRGAATRHGPPMSDNLNTLIACGMTGFKEGEFDAIGPERKLQILDENALAIERDRCGTHRHLRKCNECRYQHGDLRPQLKGRGRSRKASEMPILPSRRTSTFGTFLDRWFPAVSDALDHKRPGYNTLLHQAIYREKARDRPLAVYMARCNGCARWQELRNFRIRSSLVFPHWRPNVASGYRRSETTPEKWAEAEASLDVSRCNACFAAEHGREDLARELCSWFQGLSSVELTLLSCTLIGGTLFEFNPFYYYAGAPREYRRQLKCIMQHRRVDDRQSPEFNVSYSGIAILRLRQAHWKALWERTKLNGDTSWTTCDMDAWYTEWVNNFDEAEEHWRWLMSVKNEIEERPMALVQWALGESDIGQ